MQETIEESSLFIQVTFQKAGSTKFKAESDRLISLDYIKAKPHRSLITMLN